MTQKESSRLPQTFTLTTGLDSGTKFTGGATDDDFNGVASSASADNTITAGDSLVGGAGTDTLNVTIAGTATSTGAGVSTSGIERLAISNVNTSGDATVDATLMAGLKSVQVTGGLQNTSVTGLDSVVDVSVVASSKNVSLAAASAAVTVGTADTSTITLNAAARSGSVDLTYNGVENLKVVTTGTASGALNANGSVLYDVELIGNAVNTVSVTGTAGLVAKVNFASSGQTVSQVNSFDASAAGAGVTATIANAGASGLVSVKGSAKNDTVDITALTLSDKISVVGGEGTDTLLVGGTISAVTSGTQPGANVSGFETLSLASGASVELSALSGNTTFTSATLNGAGTISKAGSALQTINQAGSGNISYARATDGTADALTINLNNPTAAFSGTVTASGEETINLASNAGAASTVSSLSGAALTKLVVTGAQDLSITTAAATTKLASVDASALTGTNVVSTTAFTLDASANTAAMTVKGSATGRNVVTGGSGSDNITGGAGNDSIVGGLGADTLVGDAGNDTLNGGSGADNISGGDGNDNIVGDIGNDVLDGGAGNDTINAGSGSDTVTGGEGNDRIYASSLDTDDNIDGGAGSDILSAQVVSTYFSRSDYVTATGDVAATVKGVETAYVQAVATAASTTAATAETLDLTGVTGLTTLNLDVNDSGNDAFMVVKNFGGSSIVLSETANPEKLTIDGVGQDLSVTLRNYDGTTSSSEATVFTGVAALTLRGEATIAESASSTVTQSNVLGAITAATATGLTFSTSSSTASVGRSDTALKVGTVAAGTAQTISLSAASYTTLTTGVITAGTDVSSVTITVSDNGYLALGSAGSADTTADLNLSTSSLVSSSLTVGVGGRLYDGATTQQSTISAASMGVFTGSIGASAAVDLSIAANFATGSTLSMQSASTWTAGVLGGAGASSLTVSGVGNMDASSTTLKGTTFTLNVSGLEDTDGVVVAADTATLVNITGTAFVDSLTGGTGNDTLSGGAGNDILAGGGGADSIVGGLGNDIVTGGAGADTLTGSGGTDTFIYTGTGATLTGQGGDTITDFTVASDVISFAQASLVANGTTLATGALTSTAFVETTTGLTIAATSPVYVYEYAATSALTATSATNATSVATALEAAFDFASTTAANSDLIFAVNDGTNTYLWYYDGNTTNVTIEASELTLMATLTGVTAGALTHSNFTIG